MKQSGLLISAFLLAAASSAVAQDIRYDFDKDKDFSKYKTYKWVAIKGAQLPDELTQRAITSAIDTQLGAKGLTKTDSDNAGLYIGYQTALGQEKEFTSFNTGWGYGPGWGGWLVWLWRHELNYDIRFDVYRIRGAFGFEHVRPRSKTAGLERVSLEDTGSQSKAGQETEKHQQSCRETPKKVSPRGEEVAAPILSA